MSQIWLSSLLENLWSVEHVYSVEQTEVSTHGGCSGPSSSDRIHTVKDGNGVERSIAV